MKRLVKYLCEDITFYLSLYRKRFACSHKTVVWNVLPLYNVSMLGNYFGR